MWTLIGLGNPGSRYEHTRHNVGFDLLDLLGKRWDIPISQKSQVMHFGSGEACGTDVLLVKPMTYMNRSGAVIPALRRQEEFDLSRCLVIYDEMQLGVGSLRIRSKGSAGGHNGLKHIIEVAKTQDIPRMRIGIGAPSRAEDWADFVLEEFSKNERDVIEDTLITAIDAVETLLSEGLTKSMTKFNSTTN